MPALENVTVVVAPEPDGVDVAKIPARRFVYPMHTPFTRTQPVVLMSPATSSLYEGVVSPMPMNPFDVSTKSDEVAVTWLPFDA
jgi:hypothetical protein